MGYHKNKYSLGKAKLKVFRPNGVVGSLKSHEELCFAHGSWCQGLLSVDKLRLVNQAFDFYYTSVNCIASTKAKRRIKKEILINALTNGWGHGIQDLDDLFKHIAQNNGDWIDDTRQKPYLEGFLFRCNIDLPLPIYHFANAMSDSMKPLNTASDHISKLVSKLANNIAPADLSQILEQVSKKSKSVEHLVLLDKISNKSQHASTRCTGRVFGKVSTYTDVISAIDSALKDYEAALKFGHTNEKGAIAYASFTTILGFIPILGEFYQQMGRFIPLIEKLLSKFNLSRKAMREMGLNSSGAFNDL